MERRLDNIIGHTPMNVNENQVSASKHPTVWFEISSSGDAHGGPGWELGTCIWSPTTAGNGQPYYGYQALLKPLRGDAVVHHCDKQFLGLSRVVRECQVVQKGPPQPGPWINRKEYYRIELEGFRRFDRPVAAQVFRTKYAEEIREDILANKPRIYPFVIVKPDRIATAQGLVLAMCTPQLVRLVSVATGVDLLKGP